MSDDKTNGTDIIGAILERETAAAHASMDAKERELDAHGYGLGEAVDINAGIAEAVPVSEPVQKQKGMATLPISLDREQRVFELKIREPGIVRGAAIHIEQPKVFAGGMRNVQLVQPVLFVECDPSLDVRSRRFMWVSSDEVIKTKPGTEAQWRATATAAPHIRHLFELVQVPS